MKPLPAWLTIKSTPPAVLAEMKQQYGKFNLHTVCEEAHCPNAGHCFYHKTATLLILGKICTRNCSFCAIEKGTPLIPDPMEPRNTAKLAKALNLRYVVITSVTRDDLPDGGADQFLLTLRNMRKTVSGIITELLIPDFAGSHAALAALCKAAPEVVGHNIETIPRLYEKIRPGAQYQRSIKVLKRVKELRPGIITKSGIMVGFGEKFEEVVEVMKDLRAVGVSLLTIGQYLPPSPKHYPVADFIKPQEFELYRKKALELGFSHVASAPLVRSSYEAAQAYAAALANSKDNIS